MKERVAEAMTVSSLLSYGPLPADVAAVSVLQLITAVQLQSSQMIWFRCLPVAVKGCRLHGGHKCQNALVQDKMYPCQNAGPQLPGS